MSHSLHRSGGVDCLLDDYTTLSLGIKGYNTEETPLAVGEAAKVALRHNSINGVWTGWTGPEITPDTPAEAFIGAKVQGGTHAVFTSEEDLVGFLREMRELDMGISVVVSGLFDHVHDCCRRAGLEPHTVNTSLGVWGKTDLLPEERVLDISTMCGHGLVTFALIKDCADKIRSGKMTPEQAAEKMRPLCYCGIFNTKRAARILSRISAEPSE